VYTCIFIYSFICGCVCIYTYMHDLRLGRGSGRRESCDQISIKGGCEREENEREGVCVYVIYIYTYMCVCIYTYMDDVQPGKGSGRHDTCDQISSTGVCMRERERERVCV